MNSCLGEKITYLYDRMKSRQFFNALEWERNLLKTQQLRADTLILSEVKIWRWNEFIAASGAGRAARAKLPCMWRHTIRWKEDKFVYSDYTYLLTHQTFVWSLVLWFSFLIKRKKQQTFSDENVLLLKHCAPSDFNAGRNVKKAS